MKTLHQSQRGTTLLELVIGIVVAGFALALLAVMIPLAVDQTQDAITADETQAGRSCGEGLVALHAAGRLTLDACGGSAPEGWADSEGPFAEQTAAALGDLCATEPVIAQCDVRNAPPENTSIARIRVQRQGDTGSTLLQLELPFTPEGS